MTDAHIDGRQQAKQQAPTGLPPLAQCARLRLKLFGFMQRQFTMKEPAFHPFPQPPGLGLQCIRL